jgi:16S rRNA (adenine1518-N6/adenine1519-N6)-dimethyltransferase
MQSHGGRLPDNSSNSLNSVRKTLARYEIHPRKRLGQSFLEDLNIIRRICDLTAPGPEETVVEIGAGLGLLTAELARKARRVIALEIDPRLISILNDRFSGESRVVIVPGDVLDFDFFSASPERPVKIVGNIPYHISTPILFRLLEFRKAISTMVLMFQKELADRIAASPGSKEYGIPSVIVGRFASITRAMSVPSSCFYPEPSVVSSVLRIVMRDEPIQPGEELCFVTIVKAAFSMRRKTLWNNLRAAGFPEESLKSALTKSCIEGVRRAETLSVGEFQSLTEALTSFCAAEKILDMNRGA